MAVFQVKADVLLLGMVGTAPAFQQMGCCRALHSKLTELATGAALAPYRSKNHLPPPPPRFVSSPTGDWNTAQ